MLIWEKMMEKTHRFDFKFIYNDLYRLFIFLKTWITFITSILKRGFFSQKSPLFNVYLLNHL